MDDLDKVDFEKTLPKLKTVEEVLGNWIIYLNVTVGKIQMDTGMPIVNLVAATFLSLGLQL